MTLSRKVNKTVQKSVQKCRFIYAESAEFRSRSRAANAGRSVRNPNRNRIHLLCTYYLLVFDKIKAKLCSKFYTKSLQKTLSLSFAHSAHVTHTQGLHTLVLKSSQAVKQLFRLFSSAPFRPGCLQPFLPGCLQPFLPFVCSLLIQRNQSKCVSVRTHFINCVLSYIG